MKERTADGIAVRESIVMYGSPLHQSLHIAQWGVYITTPEVTDKYCHNKCKTKLINDEAEC